MAHIDLSHLTAPTLTDFVVALPDGDLTLRPIVALPSEGQVAMLRVSGRLSEIDDTGSMSSMVSALADALPDVDVLLRAACPSKTAANKLMKVLAGHLTEKIQLAVAYLGQTQSGEASASTS